MAPVIVAVPWDNIMEERITMTASRFRMATLVGLAGLLAVEGGLRAEVVRLRYKRSGGYSAIGSVRPASVRQQTSAQGVLTGEPRYASSKPMYFEMSLGPRPTRYVLVIDESGGTGSGYDRLYVDANGNGDLRDDRPVQGSVRRRGTYAYGQFTGGQVLIDYGAGQRAPWQFSAYYRTYQSSGRTRTYLSVIAAGYYEGLLSIGGRRLKAAVVDADSNGCFGDYYEVQKGATSSSGSFYVWGDRIMLDLNGDGRYDVQPLGSAESLGCGRYLLLGGRCYEVAIAPSGQTLTLSRSQAPMGALLREGGGTFALGLLSEENGMLTVRGEGKPLLVPADKYRLYWCAFEAKDARGVVWKATGTATTKAGSIEVPRGGVASAKFGPPLKVGVTARALPGGKPDAVSPGNTLRLNLEVKGQAGELYSAGSMTRGGKRLSPPGVRVVAPDDRVVATGQFRYG